MLNPLLIFSVQVVLLLAVPGPTNTLLCLSGRQAGFGTSSRLVAVELAGYLSVVLPASLYLGPLLLAYPSAALATTGAAICWIAFLSIKLWRSVSRGASHGRIGIREVYLTTLLNPKAMIVGLVLMPSGSLVDLAPWYAVFAALVAVIGSTWVAAGGFAAISNRPVLSEASFRRAAALCLGAFACIMGYSVALTLTMAA
jgi:threonine/homoserine/homoserine lactone efflux protein